MNTAWIFGLVAELLNYLSYFWNILFLPAGGAAIMLNMFYLIESCVACCVINVAMSHAVHVAQGDPLMDKHRQDTLWKLRFLRGAMTCACGFEGVGYLFAGSMDAIKFLCLGSTSSKLNWVLKPCEWAWADTTIIVVKALPIFMDVVALTLIARMFDTMALHFSDDEIDAAVANMHEEQPASADRSETTIHQVPELLDGQPCIKVEFRGHALFSVVGSLGRTALNPHSTLPLPRSRN